MSDNDLDIFFESLVNIEKWAERWQLPLSIEKSSIMLFSQSLHLVSGSNLKLGHQVLTPATKTLDLGVTFDPDLKFNEQINLVCRKARKRLHIIKKKFFQLIREY